MSKNRKMMFSFIAIAFATLCACIIFAMLIWAQPKPLSSITASYTTESPGSDMFYLTGPIICYPKVILSEKELKDYSGERVILSSLEDVQSERCLVDGSYVATLQFATDLPNKNEHGIVLPGIYCWYSLYCNGDKISQSGLYQEGTAAFPSPKYIQLPETGTGYYAFTLQVKTPVNSITGTISTILVGSWNKINLTAKSQRSIAFILLCFLSFIIVFCFVQTISMRKDRTLLAFLIVALILIVYVLFCDDVLIMRLIPTIPFQAGIVITSITKPLFLISLMLYFYSFYAPLFKKEIFWGVAALMIIPMLNGLTFEKVIPLNRLSILILALPYIACFYVLLKAMNENREHTAILTLSLISFFYGDALAFVTSDFVLQSRHNMLPGTIIFGMSQVAILAKRYADQDSQEEKITQELAETLETMQASENAFLNAQMKPHFLYNTLNTIADLCVTNPPKAQTLIAMLKEYVQMVLSIDNIEETVSLTQEVKLTRTYYKIEKERFPDIEFFEDIPLRLPALAIPPLVLQPLVENAIKHGVRKNSKGGLIKIRVKDFPDHVEFQVSDDGIGMDRETIGKMFRIPKENKSIGIYNIDKRLNNLYGSGLRIDSSPGQGTCISFVIPK